MIAATLGVVFLLYETALLILAVTRDRPPLPAPGPAEDDTQTMVMRIIPPPNVTRTTAELVRDQWARLAWERVDDERWPHLTPRWRDETGTFAALMEAA